MANASSRDAKARPGIREGREAAGVGEASIAVSRHSNVTTTGDEKAADCFVTSQCSLGDESVVAYSAKRSLRGPNGEARVAFLLRTLDRGATWRHVPLTRDAWSFLIFPGFPVWPPEFVSNVELGSETVTITFRDEWVIYEPGGESLWTGALSPRGVWRIRRVRRMRYEEGEDDSETPPLPLRLPAGFAAPDAALVERVAARAGAYLYVGVPDWLWWVPALAVGILVGEGSLVRAASLLAAAVLGMPLLWFLIDRQRQRRAARGADSAPGDAKESKA